MAVKYFCENPECPGYRKTISEHKVQYVMREGKLVPSKTPKCKDCGEPMAYTEINNAEVPNFNIGEFAGMTNLQKSEMLKKRANEANKKDNVIEKKRYYTKKVLKNFFGGK